VYFAASKVEVTVPPGEVLLEVAEQHGVQIGSLCRGGTCGTCRVRLRSGSPFVSSTKALTLRHRQAGFILACSSRTVAGQRIVLDA
jgi:ferredoxin